MSKAFHKGLQMFVEYIFGLA